MDESRALGPSPPNDRDSALTAAASTAWKLTIIAVAVLLFGYILQMVSSLIVALVVALLIAALVNPVVRWLDRRRVPRVLAVLLPMLALAAALAGGGAVVGYTMSAERSGLAGAVRTVAAEVQRIAGWVSERLAGTPLEELTTSMSGGIDEVPAMAARVVAEIASALATLILAAVLCFFLLLDVKRLRGSIAKRMDPDRFTRLAGLVEESWWRFEQYMRGITITALANSLLFGLALLIIGVPLVLANMVILFVGSYVPYLGPVIATTVACLLALTDGGITDVLLVIGAGVAVQLIEGNVLQPFVVGHAVSMPAFMVVISAAAGGVIAGLLGAVIAIPVMVAGIIFLDGWREQRASKGAAIVDS